MAAFTRVNPRISGNITGKAPHSVVLVADGLYTATGSAEFSIGTAHAIEAEINVVSGDAGFAAIFCLEGYNPASGNWDTLANTGTIATDIPCTLLAGPFVPQVTNNSVAHVLRERMRLTVHHADTKCIEYSLVVHGQ